MKNIRSADDNRALALVLGLRSSGILALVLVFFRRQVKNIRSSDNNQILVL